MYRKQDWDTPLPRQSAARASEAEPTDEGGWQDWPPSAEMALQTLPINVIVGRHGVPRARETTRRARDAANRSD